MNFKMNVAERKNVKMKINLSGPSGSGKTFSALRLANGLVDGWSKIVVLDTENDSSGLYSHLGNFNVITLSAPFDPRRYIEAIKFCESQPGIECIIIDSISHEWEGVGGCLDIHAKLGGRFEQWQKVTPLHDSFKQAIIQSPKHIITTVRSKTDYDMNKDSNGKTKIEKVGMKSITREGFDYEVTISFRLNQSHYAEVDKDRTNLFNDSIPFLITEETGKKIKDWNANGKSSAIKKQTIIDTEEVRLKKEFIALKNELIGMIKEQTRNGELKDKLGMILKALNIQSTEEIIKCTDTSIIALWLNTLEYEISLWDKQDLKTKTDPISGVYSEAELD